MSNPHHRADALRILFIASEADPFVKVGGLGDVAGSLPAALHSLEPATDRPGAVLDIRLVIPFHAEIQREKFKIRPLVSYTVAHDSGPIPVEAYQTELNQVPVYLLAGPPMLPGLPVYTSDHGYDAHRYIYFSLAALELARHLDWQPHILHANDWHTASAVYWLVLNRPVDSFFRQTASLLTVHNLPFMGVGAEFPMHAFHLPPADCEVLPTWARQLPLPLGLYSADHIVTVSPTYAHEILTPEFGCGLEDFLRTRQHALTGILNGLDTRRWNPQDDAFLSATFSAEALDLRNANKAAVLNELDFISQLPWKEEVRVPLLAMVSRLDYQKGIDLAIEALHLMASTEPTSQLPWRAVLLGTGLPEFQASARSLEADFPDRIRVAQRFDIPLSHRIYGGADMLLMPSRYEPCGLSQMIAMRYGCVPIGRGTGGLCDTIQDYDCTPDSSGFLFNLAEPQELAATIQHALQVYCDLPAWQGLQRRGMRRDYSWRCSAEQYRQLYYSLVKSA